MALFSLGHPAIQVGEPLVTGVGRHPAIDMRAVHLALEVPSPAIVISRHVLHRTRYMV